MHARALSVNHGMGCIKSQARQSSAAASGREVQTVREDAASSPYHAIHLRLLAQEVDYSREFPVGGDLQVDAQQKVRFLSGNGAMRSIPSSQNAMAYRT